MLKEFKEFALKGNVLDLAIGVIIGAAFSSIITSLVQDILMPLISLPFGNLNYENLFASLDGNQYPTLAAAQEAGASTLNYGLFLTYVINFLLVGFILFLIIRGINRMKRQPPPETNTKECPYCDLPIPLKAVRCPECTSELPGSTPAVRPTGL